MILWEQTRELAACKVAIAGDYLPAGSLQPRDAATCQAMAEQARVLFEDADVGIANLESPVDVAGLPAPPNGGLGATLAAPEETLHYLKALRVQAVGLANNHIFDYGLAGFERTRAALARNGLVPLGCGRTLSHPPEVFVWESPTGVRVGFWAAANISAVPATATKAGTDAANLERGKIALAAMSEQRAQCCIALLHAGLERTNYPEPADVEMMDALAHAGFAVVAACHSHRISGHKLIKTQHGHAACFYGLGSISSGMMYSPLEREGIAAVIGLNGRGEVVRISANPVWLSDSGWGVAPGPEQAQTTGQRFLTVSRHIEDGSFRQRFHDDISKGLFRGQFRDIRAAFRQAGLQGIVQKFSRLRLRHLSRAIHAVSAK
ncbi:MAG TPA: CapA family protein [Terriglobales bacterium]|nr:CapA family protein [Terriglobales bacterium]